MIYKNTDISKFILKFRERTGEFEYLESGEVFQHKKEGAYGGKEMILSYCKFYISYR